MSDDNFDEEEPVIDEESRARRADPLKFFCEALELLRNTPPESFLKIFRARATNARGEADDMMYCFEQVAANPPANLAELLFQYAGFKLFHIEPSSVTPYSYEEVAAWLRDLTAKMRAIYDE